MKSRKEPSREVWLYFGDLRIPFTKRVVAESEYQRVMKDTETIAAMKERRRANSPLRILYRMFTGR